MSDPFGDPNASAPAPSGNPNADPAASARERLWRRDEQRLASFVTEYLTYEAYQAAMQAQAEARVDAIKRETDAALHGTPNEGTPRPFGTPND